MKLEKVLNKEELEKIKKIGEMAINLKFSISEYGTMNSEALGILMRIVDSDAENLMRDIIDDKFFEYIDKGTERRKS